MNVREVTADLLAEQAALDPIVRGLSATDWDTPTASPRWSVTDQAAHLTYFDHTAAFAIASPERWDEEMQPPSGARAQPSHGPRRTVNSTRCDGLINEYRNAA